MTTLADAVRAQFERDHPNGKNTLLCVGLCRRRKDREDFREMPWHGRAASCVRCETFPGPAGRSLWQTEYDARIHWELEQARAKLHMYQRYASWLKSGGNYRQRYVMDWPSSASVRPWERVTEARRRKWTPAISEVLSKAHTLSEEES
ncbi:hypothetical protein [Streptomyces sp. NPDC102264]|uniref:hypothetical protein n=1 Tax=Streptomyces sp. NPDC102264 TaxID=3366149 RepID=UPI0038160D40